MQFLSSELNIFSMTKLKILYFSVECESDSECPETDTCHNGQCISPCILDNRCAINAECYGVNHRANCKCTVGFFGNPEIHCERAECTNDYDCPQNLACKNSHCVNPCSVESPCAQNAICFVQNHHAACHCPEHMPVGNPHSYCERRHEPECSKDIDCPSKLACIKEICVNPCTEFKPCFENARCSVLDTVPVRTMVCTCPSGWMTDIDGLCRPSMFKNNFFYYYYIILRLS